MSDKQKIRKVKVEGDTLRFNSAHFVTYSGQCESLHGHNYRVQIELQGILDQDSLVFNFTRLKQVAGEVCNQLHHRFLLAMHNPHLELRPSSESWEIRFQARRYVIPRSDVVELPIDNATAERLSEYICNELCNRLALSDFPHLSSITVGVEEGPTQVAYYSQSLRIGVEV